MRTECEGCGSSWPEGEAPTVCCPPRKRGRPRLTEGEHPIGVKVNLPAATCKAIDATGRKRSEYIRAAIAEKMERER